MTDMAMKTTSSGTRAATASPLDAPDWLVERVGELSRLMSSSDRSVADGIWYELIQRKLVQPNVIPGRVLGPLGWKPPTQSVAGATVQITEESA